MSRRVRRRRKNARKQKVSAVSEHTQRLERVGESIASPPYEREGQGHYPKARLALVARLAPAWPVVCFSSSKEKQNK